jgi:hypothetical protein
MAPIMSMLLQAAAFLLAFVALASCLHKFLKPARTKAATVALTGMPPAVAHLLWLAAALLEAAGTLVAFPETRLVGAVLLAALWSAYAVALGMMVIRGEPLADCGCSFGRTASAHTLPRGVTFRAAALATTAWLLALLPGGVVTALEAAMLILPATAFFLFYMAADQLGGRPSMEIRS